MEQKKFNKQRRQNSKNHKLLSIFAIAISANLITACATTETKEKTVASILTQENDLLQKLKVERAEANVTQAVSQNGDLQKAETHLLTSLNELIEANKVIVSKILNESKREVTHGRYQ